MKFISKQGNYRVVLKQGQPPEPLTGRIAVPGIYVKFENGKVNVNDDMKVGYGDKEFSLVELMKRHPAFGRDFICAEEDAKDPWADFRRDKEPEHDILDIKYGQVAGNVNPRPKLVLSKDKQHLLREMAEEMATKMAQEMAPKMAKELLDKLVAETSVKEDVDVPEKEVQDEDIKEDAAVEKKRGRPAKVQIDKEPLIPEVDKTTEEIK